jgi:hypothetical protein
VGDVSDVDGGSRVGNGDSAVRERADDRESTDE